MKNQPEKIYLNVGFDESCYDVDFNDLSEVTWTKAKIYEADLEYVKSCPDEPITQQALLDRGFSFRICHYNGEVSDNYRLVNKNISIEIYRENFSVIELQTEFYLLTIPNCRTLKQLDALIDLFKEG